MNSHPKHGVAKPSLLKWLHKVVLVSTTCSNNSALLPKLVNSPQTQLVAQRALCLKRNSILVVVLLPPFWLIRELSKLEIQSLRVPHGAKFVRSLTTRVSRLKKPARQLPFRCSASVQFLVLATNSALRQMKRPLAPLRNRVNSVIAR